ncbi:hypothetical protein PAXINDRAFT_152801 [Paxillus involutus ATCC 200175]|nr:hypothetical protein PAXINDRAFT_152801 [Paxillus involutus ATCC 200175]
MTSTLALSPARCCCSSLSTLQFVELPLKFLEVAAFTVIIWEALITFGDEVTYVWSFYALYERNKFVIALAAFTVLVEFMMTVACAVVAIPASHYDFACLVLDILPEGIVFFMVGTFLSQTILLGLASRKKNVARGHQERPSVAWITIRDGAYMTTVKHLLIFVDVFLGRRTSVVGFLLCLETADGEIQRYLTEVGSIGDVAQSAQ